ncbi:DUF4257 domain-containing protein [Niallia taxi]|uniref:DUF4257 domain-containing protein n=1 Tax=Niallia taxi TaxID=2499688 RepID=UPI002040C25A|nr:DUF4257 domain-containing protein [Niallia taxi]MCM3216816.1 DUF4257 domain-containing protein [Niallia taxi]
MLESLVIAGCIGGFMGLLTHAKRNNTIKKPRNHKTTFNPGVLLDIGFGAVGAIVAIADPNGMERIFLTAILGGYAGENAINMVEKDKTLKNNEVVNAFVLEENEELPPANRKKKEQ